MVVMGACAVITSPQGEIIANSCDMERQSYGGYTLEEAQAFRARNAVKLGFMKEHMNDWMRPHVSRSDADTFWKLAERAGYTLTVFPIQGAAEPAANAAE